MKNKIIVGSLLGIALMLGGCVEEKNDINVEDEPNVEETEKMNEETEADVEVDVEDEEANTEAETDTTE
jgi:PBP1b-binding outer membrane lipoprotein LpoB